MPGTPFNQALTLPQKNYSARFPGNNIGTWQIVNSGTLSASFSGTGASLEEVWDINVGGNYQVQESVPMKDLAQFCQNFLGYSKSAGVDQGINRVIPAQHPEISYLWASRIAMIEGLAPLGINKDQVATWQALRLRLTYETPPYRIVPNAQVDTLNGWAAEWQRYCTIDSTPATEFIQRSGGTYRWADGTPIDVSGNGEVLLGPGDVIPGDNMIGVKVTRHAITITWHLVPDNGLFPGGFFTSSQSPRIEACVGTVNSFTFMGRPPYTMLLEGWKATPRVMPWGIGSGATYPLAWDVELRWIYFNPPYDPKVNGAVGHLGVPHPSNGYWYAAINPNGESGTGVNEGVPGFLPGANPDVSDVGGTSDTLYIYPRADHGQVFAMNS